MSKNTTFDHKRLNANVGLYEVDLAFRDWFDKKLDLHIKDKDGNKKKVPIFFFSSERWNKAREDGGLRDANGTLVLPIVAILRTGISIDNSGPYGRVFQDTGEDYVVSKRVHPKSSLIKELNESRPKNIDPSLPIYEMYTVPVPDHYQLTYEVKIWTSYVEEMNEIIEKMSQEMNFLSERSFQFETKDGYYFTAFQSDDFDNDSNLTDYSDNERIIRFSTIFTVPAHLLPSSKERKSTFKRYLSQSKLVVKTETEFTEDELEELFGSKK